ncbi:MAG: hypothetical protein U9Q74_07135 [Gemmatimonadota bacterium]|nr:hypothetical protein [Gemmatimonadota bacterium]
MRRLVLLLAITAACAREAPAPVQAIARATDLGATARDPGPATASTDFEAFTPGAIDGQFDWKSLGGAGAPPPANPLDTHCAVYDHVIEALDHKDAPGSFRTRALRISNAVTSGCYADQTFSARAGDIAGQAGAVSLKRDGSADYALPGSSLRNHFDAEWTFISTTPGALQAGLEVVVNPARGDDHRMSWLRMADLADGIAITFGERANPAAPGDIQLRPVVKGLKRKEAHTLRLSIDFLDGPANDVARVYVDDRLRYVGTTWETYYALDPSGVANFGGNPPAVNRLMFRTGSDAHRGIPGDAAPALLGKGFLFDGVVTRVWSVPATPAACAGNGWQDLRDWDGKRFGNQKDCERADRQLTPR